VAPAQNRPNEAAGWKLFTQDSSEDANLDVQYSLAKCTLQPQKIIRHLRTCTELTEKKGKIPHKNNVIFTCGKLTASLPPKRDKDV
jgi:hypothetical protein